MAELTAALPLIPHESVDWERVCRASYLVDQVLRYEYPGPVERLRHRLVVFPPRLHGGQRLQSWHLQVSGPRPRIREEIDLFGNRVCYVTAPRTERVVEFEIRFLVERNHQMEADDGSLVSGGVYLEPSPLTVPDAALEQAAQAIARTSDPDERHLRLNEWVWQSLTYSPGVTDVATTAAAAFARRAGVCQDFAHVMLSLCRLVGLPARYVSGHLLGEGATHAWVEVLAPDPADVSRLTIQALDPTHGRRCRADYITVAVGRDYADVPPTSGTFHAPYQGRLVSRKLAGVTEIEYFGLEMPAPTPIRVRPLPSD